MKLPAISQAISLCKLPENVVIT